MNITVHYLSILQVKTGCSQEILSVPEGTTTKDLLHIIADKYGESLRKVLFYGNRKQEYIQLVRNKKLIKSGEIVPLKEWDEIYVLVALSGG